MDVVCSSTSFPQLLTAGKGTRRPLNRIGGSSRGGVHVFGEEIHILFMPGFETRNVQYEV